TQLQWSDRLRKLTMDATNLHFQYTYNFVVDPTVFSLNAFVSEDLAVNTARDILARLEILEGSLGMDLDQENYTAQQLRFDGTKLVQSTTLFNTSAIRVDYFRSPLDTVPMVSPHFYVSPVNITISSKANQTNIDYYPQILELNYSYWRIEKTKFGTYPIVSADIAYTQFEQNYSRYLVFAGEEDDPQVSYVDKKINIVSTREAELGYYNPEKYQQYLQPVWIFKGKATIETGQQLDFVAYVPAVSAEWIQ
ncbi:hypothetical protein KC571_03415, partial [candidate division WWE3 bacterium]|nr:hypothetical protein [candidate division WWE3 bacterium]